MIEEKKLIEDIKSKYCDLDFMDSGVIQLFIDEINKQPQADKWIPCEERLPEGKEADKILVTDKDGIMAVCYFLEVTKVFKVRWNGEEFQGAFAWQPLPAPYKKEGVE